MSAPGDDRDEDDAGLALHCVGELSGLSGSDLRFTSGSNSVSLWVKDAVRD